MHALAFTHIIRGVCVCVCVCVCVRAWRVAREQIRRQLDDAILAQKQAEQRADERLDEIQDARAQIETVCLWV